jgi:hypothetical protein
MLSCCTFGTLKCCQYYWPLKCYCIIPFFPPRYVTNKSSEYGLLQFRIWYNVNPSWILKLCLVLMLLKPSSCGPTYMVLHDLNLVECIIAGIDCTYMLKWLTGVLIVIFWIMMPLDWVVTNISDESAACIVRWRRRLPQNCRWLITYQSIWLSQLRRLPS